jgi:acyl carrier protein
VNELVAWINARLVPPGVVIDEHTPLFETGLIDSIRILHLIAWTERAIGRRIPDELIRLDRFRSAGAIADAFPEKDHAHC